jgi:hypothetical protein
MAISIRNTAASCLSVPGRVSIRNDIFGYIWGPMNRQLSVKNHLNLIKDTAFNLSLILVGHEPDFSGAFTQANAQQMQAAIDVMRGLYAQVGLGVRKLYWQYIPSADAGGYNVVDGSEATDLTEDWSGDNDGIDVFFVTTVTDAGGWSKVNGSCNKDTKGERTGSVLELGGGDQFVGVLLGHEVGHYLGLSHGNDITNIMGADTNNDGIGEIGSGSTGITASQGNTMKSHCSIRPSC